MLVERQVGGMHWVRADDDSLLAKVNDNLHHSVLLMVVAEAAAVVVEVDRKMIVNAVVMLFDDILQLRDKGLEGSVDPPDNMDLQPQLCYVLVVILFDSL